MKHFDKYGLDRSNMPINNHYWVGAAISAGASLLNGFMNRKTSDDNAERRLELDEKNFKLQQEQFDYQKELQKQIFDREDTSYQRTADDMRAAGLNPLSMNGTNGAGEAIMTSAPQHDIYAGDRAGLDISDFANQLGSLGSTILQEANMREANKQARLKTLEDKMTFDSKVNAMNASNERSTATWDYMKKYGLTDLSTEWEKNLTAVQNLVDSEKYLSYLESAKKLAEKLTPEAKKVIDKVTQKASGDLLASMENSFTSLSKNAWDEQVDKWNKEREERDKAKKEKNLSKRHDKAMNAYVGYQYKNSNYYKNNVRK